MTTGEPAEGPRTTRVVLVSGTGRSGSTLLGNLLGETPGWFAAGEVRYLWERGVVERRRCGCGEPVPSCPVWGAVLERLTAARPGLDPRRLATELAGATRLRHLPLALASRGRYERRLGHLPSLLGDLYRVVADTTNAATIVDTSKLPLYGVALAASPEIDLTVVHLVRSPHAAAHSWLRTKPLDDGSPRSIMERRGATKSAVLWTVWNGSTAPLLSGNSYIRLRWEDIVADPAARLRSLLGRLGVRDDLAFLDGSTAALSVNHNVAGNPDRLRAGPVQLRDDQGWLRALSRRDARRVRLLTAPLASRYGYSPDGRMMP